MQTTCIFVQAVSCAVLCRKHNVYLLTPHLDMSLHSVVNVEKVDFVFLMSALPDVEQTHPHHPGSAGKHGFLVGAVDSADSVQYGLRCRMIL